MFSEYRPVDFLPGTCCLARGPVAIQSTPIYHLQRHDCLEIGYCHEGQAVYVVDGRTVPVSAGDAIFIEQDIAHLGCSVGDVPSLWSWLFVDTSALLATAGAGQTGDLMRLLVEPGQAGHVAAQECPTVGRWITDLLAELREDRPNTQVAARGLLLALLSHRARLPGAPGPSRQPPRHHDKLLRLQPALEFIRDRFAQSVTVAQLADLCFTSPSNLWRLFRDSLNMSPQQYLHLVRIQAATRQLTGTDQGIYQIASRMGYPTLSSFNRAFRQITGVTPRQWRRRR